MKIKSSEMQNGEPLAIRVQSPSGESSGEIYVRRWGSRERVVRAIKALGMSWAGALVAVLIPMMHFILVPSFILAGPIVAFFIYQQQSTVLGGSSTCPKCKSSFQIVRCKEHWPLKDVCSKCFENVTIQKV